MAKNTIRRAPLSDDTIKAIELSLFNRTEPLFGDLSLLAQKGYLLQIFQRLEDAKNDGLPFTIGDALTVEVALRFNSIIGLSE